jgi:hypothetical protein
MLWTSKLWGRGSHQAKGGEEGCFRCGADFLYRSTERPKKHNNAPSPASATGQGRRCNTRPAPPAPSLVATRERRRRAERTSAAPVLLLSPFVKQCPFLFRSEEWPRVLGNWRRARRYSPRQVRARWSMIPVQDPQYPSHRPSVARSICLPATHHAQPRSRLA